MARALGVSIHGGPPVNGPKTFTVKGHREVSRLASPVSGTLAYGVK